MIQPVCIPLPAVISCKPQADKPAYANVPIEIEFNIPLEENLNTETGEALQIASQFNYDNIFLTVNGVSVNQYFEQPRFNFDKTILILKPDGRKFLDYIGTQSGAVVKVSFARNIIVQNDSVNLNFAKVANKSFSVQYKAEIDETAPTEQDFYVTAPRYRFSENSEPEVYESEPFSFKTIDNFINDNNNSLK